MKKLFLSVTAILAFGFVNAQEVKFGVKAGLDLATVKVPKISFGEFIISEEKTISSSETGFFIGGFAQIGLNDKLNLQPEVNYVSIDNFNMLNVPVMFEYGLSEKFEVAAGPALNYLLDAEEDQIKFNFDLGGVYNISDNLEASAKYSLGFGDVSISGIFVGVGYKF